MRYQSNRVAQIPPYLFAEINKKKAALIKSGVDVIDLGIGDPDLPTPEHIVSADSIGMVIKKENDDFVEAVNKALSDIKKDGTYESLFMKWFGVSRMPNSG